MDNSTQRTSWIYRITKRIAGASLAVVTVLACLIFATEAAQAQTYTEGVLYNFTGGDGATPEANLIFIGQNLYGTTSSGGSVGSGTVFKLTDTGSESVVHSFTSADGSGLGSGLIYRKNNLYGTAFYGGDNGYGTVFKVNPATGEATSYITSPVDVGRSKPSESRNLGDGRAGISLWHNYWGWCFWL